MPDSNPKLPTYDNPPVVEVAMSVQYAPPKGLNVAHLGAFWTAMQKTYPRVNSTGPIPPIADDFGMEQWLPPPMRLAFSNEPDCRLQMTTAPDDEWMLQVQANRLAVNWRKRGADYPRFAATLARFHEAWRAWCDFLGAQRLEQPSPTIWELVYVNTTPKGELWERPSDWPNIFPGLWGGRFVAADDLALRGTHGHWVWERSDPVVRLLVDSQPPRSSDTPPRELLMLLKLTARGPIISSESGEHGEHKAGSEALPPMTGGMNLGHEMIVLTFDAVASPRAKEHWKRHA